MFLVKGELNSL